MAQSWMDRPRELSIAHLCAAFAGGAVITLVLVVNDMPDAPTRSEMGSLIVEPRYHDWSGSVSLRSYWSFGPYQCEGDCSGHLAGWDWAKEHNITSQDLCEGSGSGSFQQGCAYYVQVSGRASDYVE